MARRCIKGVTRDFLSGCGDQLRDEGGIVKRVYKGCGVVGSGGGECIDGVICERRPGRIKGRAWKSAVK